MPSAQVVRIDWGLVPFPGLLPHLGWRLRAHRAALLGARGRRPAGQQQSAVAGHNLHRDLHAELPQ